MSQLEGPLPASERIATLDIVRGFALPGILIMNMPGFANSFFVEADGRTCGPARSIASPKPGGADDSVRLAAPELGTLPKGIGHR